MSPRSLFNIVLKIFGFFFVKEMLDYVPKLIGTVLYYFKTDYSMVGDLFYSIIVIGIFSIFAYMFIFKSNQIIDKFNLVDGFDEDHFDWNISTPLILKIALVAVGGVLLVLEVPELFRLLFDALDDKKYMGQKDSFLPYLVSVIVKVLIALLLIGERGRIVELIMERRKKKEGTNEESEEEAE